MNTFADHGGHRDTKSTSGAAILATFIPTFLTACLYITIFGVIRSKYRKIYAPRTFLGTVTEKHRTPENRSNGAKGLSEYRLLPDHFVLQHNSIDTYLFLRFLKLIAVICFVGVCLTWPIIIPVNVNGGGDAHQLDKLSFSNIDKNSYLWAHAIVAAVFFAAVFALLLYERLHLVGIRQAHYLDEPHSERLSAKTVLFTNVPRDALLPENLTTYFGKEAVQSWPVKDMGDLPSLIEARKSAAMQLESYQFDLLRAAAKNDNSRPTVRDVPLVGKQKDAIAAQRDLVQHLTKKIASHRLSPGRALPPQAGVFVSFVDQAAAHRAYDQIKFKLPVIPFADRYLDVQPKEVLWENLTMPTSMRISRSSLALALVIAFTIFFTIPIGLIGTLSNVKYLADQVSWLGWIKDLPPAVLGLLTGLVPPYLISEFTSYVPKLFRKIARFSGEPTTRQAELLVQAWYFMFQVFQVFLVTTTASGAAAVATSIMRDPASAPYLLAESLPKASNFYLTYIIFQGLTGAADNLLNYTDLLEYLFYIGYWDKTPREKFQDYAQMKGFNWAKLLPKFTNLAVIAIAYSVIAPLVLGFSLIGFCIFYLAYRYNALYVWQSKIDSHGEAYRRALQQMMTGIYLAELCLIGLFGARKAAAQTTLMIIFLILTAISDFAANRILTPLETLLGVDSWTEQEVPLLAQEDGIPEDDHERLHIASHNRRLKLNVLPRSLADRISASCDKVIQAARSRTRQWLTEPSARLEDDGPGLSEEAIKGAYANPCFTAKTPKIWIPKDPNGVSSEEISLNEEAEIPTTDDGASFDRRGHLHWERDFEKVPIFKEPTVI